MCKHRKVVQTIIAITILLLSVGQSLAENIDPDNDGSQYAYGENVGWLNFEPGGDGSDYAVTVEDDRLTGFVWAENIGWINLSPTSYGGVENDGTGQLSGYAWGENVGWINFNPNYGGVTIDADGNFNGWAWGANIGWIHFRSAAPVAYKVQTSWQTKCVVDFDDLARFCQQWLNTGPDLTADLDESEAVDSTDYSVVAERWLELCPAGWPLK